MKYALSPLAFTLGASAAVLKRSECCFQLTASGGASGSVGQLDDGQNRVGGGYQAATYCLNNGGITDSNGRGCILTPPTTQFQCDEGASPTTGFSVGENGQVTYKGNTQFYACPADEGEYNIYTEPVDDQDKCVEITLSTEGGKCASGSGQASTPVASTPVPVSPSSAPPAPSTPVASSPEAVTTMTQTHYTTTCPTSESSAPPVASTPAPVVSSYASTLPPVESPPATTLTHTTSHTQTATSVYSVTSTAAGTPSTPTGSACPTDLAGDYQYPHLIVPVNASTPSQSYGTQYNGQISTSPQICTLFNFDIPQSYAGSACSAVFLLPHKDELETSDYDLTPASGGSVSFAQLAAPADQTTAWDSVPAKKQDLGEFDIAAGTRFVVATAECQAGQTVAYEMCAQQGGDLSFEWFQDWNPSPIGLFVRKC